MEKEKRCRNCYLVLPLNAFHKNKNSSDGATYRCKQCIHKHYLYRKANPLPKALPLIRTNNTKQCTVCRQLKPLSAFHRDTDSGDGRTSGCIQCRKEFYKINKAKYAKHAISYYLRHRSEILKRQKEYRKNNKEKIRILEVQKIAHISVRRLFNRANLDFDPKQQSELILHLDQLLKNTPYCPYTGEPLVPGKNLHLDHKIPVSKGGSIIDPNNLQWTSKVYNYAKHILTNEEFARHWKITYIP
jgi:hypothetical protein